MSSTLIKPTRHIAQPSLKHGNKLDTRRNNLTILMHLSSRDQHAHEIIYK